VDGFYTSRLSVTLGKTDGRGGRRESKARPIISGLSTATHHQHCTSFRGSKERRKSSWKSRLGRAAAVWQAQLAGDEYRADRLRRERVENECIGFVSI
jgi:hypothetical protein